MNSSLHFPGFLFFISSGIVLFSFACDSVFHFQRQSLLHLNVILSLHLFRHLCVQPVRKQSLQCFRQFLFHFMSLNSAVQLTMRYVLHFVLGLAVHAIRNQIYQDHEMILFHIVIEPCETVDDFFLNT